MLAHAKGLKERLSVHHGLSFSVATLVPSVIRSSGESLLSVQPS